MSAARRHHAVAHENHERWLVSYADFITLLFAFFVVMFASTQSDKQKAKQVSDSVRQALEHGEFSNAISKLLDVPVRGLPGNKSQYPASKPHGWRRVRILSVSFGLPRRRA